MWTTRKRDRAGKPRKRRGQKFEWAEKSEERKANPMSILSEAPDGMGFYYAFIDGDNRQINVRLENKQIGSLTVSAWIAYVGGVQIAVELSKGEAERAAIKWAKEHPE